MLMVVIASKKNLIDALVGKPDLLLGLQRAVRKYEATFRSHIVVKYPTGLHPQHASKTRATGPS